jgi:lactoylglutathione lyase
MAKAIHVMIRVLDEARAIDFYRRAFGLEVADRFVFDDFTLVYLRNPEAHFEVELTVNHGRTKPYEHGDGYAIWRSRSIISPLSTHGLRTKGSYPMQSKK